MSKDHDFGESGVAEDVLQYLEQHPEGVSAQDVFDNVSSVSSQIDAVRTLASLRQRKNASVVTERGANELRYRVQVTAIAASEGQEGLPLEWQTSNSTERKNGGAPLSLQPGGEPIQCALLPDLSMSFIVPCLDAKAPIKFHLSVARAEELWQQMAMARPDRIEILPYVPPNNEAEIIPY